MCSHMENSEQLPLQLWFKSMHIITNSEGISWAILFSFTEKILLYLKTETDLGGS